MEIGILLLQSFHEEGRKQNVAVNSDQLKALVEANLLKTI